MHQDHLFEVENVASASECTGLVPALPVNDPRADEELADLYAVLPPKHRNGRRIEGNARSKMQNNDAQKNSTETQEV